METITFYSYKGGTGRSLAVANAARYLARLGFKVAVLDFDLEAPGLHYKFSTDPEGRPLPVQAGVVDYLYDFIVDGDVSKSVKELAVDVSVPGIEKPLIQLIPAGHVPSSEYWSKLARINWHQLFYSAGGKGVQIFLELKSRISDELEPDYLLVDSRTGITEMGGVATLLADKVVCLVLQTLENLEGARAVLRSLKRSRRESCSKELGMIIALSRLPQMRGAENEGGLTDWIQAMMSEEAENLEDTLECPHVFVLHSEAALQVREALRVGSGISPDDSILLRDYLRLFASFVPKESIAEKVRDLIQQAREKIWVDAAGAVKEVEELAESFGHPENYRELLRFYAVRNVAGPSILKRAQRLWELTGDSEDPILLQAVTRAFDPRPRWQKKEGEWSPNLDFVRQVWRDAGKKNPELGMRLVTAYDYNDQESLAADVLLEMIKTSEPAPRMVARCIGLLDVAKRHTEADDLIKHFKTVFAGQAEFVEAWANHLLKHKEKDKESFSELVQPPLIDQLSNIRPSTAAQVYLRAGMKEAAATVADSALREVLENPSGERELFETGDLFNQLGRFEEFEVRASKRFPAGLLEELKERLRPRRRTR